MGSAIPDLSDEGSPFLFDPGSGTGQGMQAARPVSFPSPHLEVKIMLTISFCASQLRTCSRLRLNSAVRVSEGGARRQPSRTAGDKSEHI